MADVLPRDAPGNGRFFVSPRFRTVLVLAFLLVYGGCSSSDPQIMQVDHYVTVSASGTRTIERDEHRLQAAAPSDAAETDVLEALVVSVDLFDADGSGEIAELEVLLSTSNLYWTLDVEDLAYHERDGQQWYTTAPLTIDGRSRIPRGPVVITVTDLSGRQDRREVQLPRTLPELTFGALAGMDAAGVISPADIADSLIVVAETAQGQRETRRVSDVSSEILLSQVFEREALQRLQEADQPVQVWLLQEWGTRMQSEHGPWELDFSELPLTDEP